MKALVKAKPEPGLWLEEVARPKEVGPHEVRIEIRKTGICGTDIHIMKWDEWAKATIPTPMIIGHEFYGVITELGRDITEFKVGDRVSGEAHISCGHCRNCRAGKQHVCPNTKGIGVHIPGAFAEEIVFPACNLLKLPDTVSDNVAAILDPLGNAVHTALSFNLIGEDVLITGAGPIGMMATAISKHIGAKNIVVTDMNEYRLGLAKQLGATQTVNVRTDKLEDIYHALGMEAGFDVGLEVSGNMDAFRSMIAHMYPGGHIAILGIPPEPGVIDWHQVIFKELTLKGIYGREMFETWYKMLSLLQRGLDVSPVITHNFPVEKYQEAFDVVTSGQAGKVILEWC